MGQCFQITWQTQGGRNVWSWLSRTRSAITKSITLTSGEADKLEAVAGEADKKSEAEMYAHERCPLVGVCGSAGGRLLAGAMGFPHL